MRAAILWLVTAFSFASAANAYTPETGLWYSPGEPGSGMNIEIQDNVLGLTIYAGDAQGYPIFYTAAGLLDGNAYFEAELYRYDRIQCIGCPPGPEPDYYDDVGMVRIVFDPNDNTRATLTWPNGRSIAIRRFIYGYLRGDDPVTFPSDAAKMLGEWNITVDLAESDAGYPFTADVLVLDDYYWNSSKNRWFYEGCRPDDAQIGGCSQYALDNHAAEGFFESPTGWQVIVVEDGIYNGVLWFALYELQIGTESGSGWFTLYPNGGNPGSYEGYPARAWRSASRTFVETGEGPSKAASTKRQEGLGSVLLAHGAPTAKAGASARPATAARTDIIRALEARLRER